MPNMKAVPCFARNEQRGGRVGEQGQRRRRYAPWISAEESPG